MCFRRERACVEETPHVLARVFMDHLGSTRDTAEGSRRGHRPEKVLVKRRPRGGVTNTHRRLERSNQEARNPIQTGPGATTDPQQRRRGDGTQRGSFQGLCLRGHEQDDPARGWAPGAAGTPAPRREGGQAQPLRGPLRVRSGTCCHCDPATARPAPDPEVVNTAWTPPPARRALPLSSRGHTLDAPELPFSRC